MYFEIIISCIGVEIVSKYFKIIYIWIYFK